MSARASTLGVSRVCRSGRQRPKALIPTNKAQGARPLFGTHLQIDHEVGQILAALEESGRLDNTIVIFLFQTTATWSETTA